MAGPGDGTAAGAAGHSHLRASHADRDQVIDMLKAAFVQGRLSKDEFDLRVGQVLASRTYAVLAVLTADIPAGQVGATPPKPLPGPEDQKALGRGRRIDVMAGLPVAAASIVLAMAIHRTLVYCSYPGGPPPPCSQPVDYPMALRLGIVAAGFIAAGLIIAISRHAHRRRG